ncbi:rna-directed dna polymerase from mobile element jockey-like protein [Lasius niger]|uniref:Rna-directed dna polymerase from mobile element jockey-like protein n=1 Tax=Lasius niger TaxID=67767 RepID=A0A0J7KDQ0_LASNI|nr:rna-directed dna polymerase from mobile element jockey-like protein [Lasius niger]
MSEAEIRSELMAQNLNNEQTKDLRIVYIFKPIQDRQTTSCIIEVSPGARKTLLKSGRIYLRYSACPFADHVRIVQCYKCLAFGHYAAACKAESACARCAGNHETRDCKKDIMICHVNCQSLYAHFDEFRHNFTNSDYHVICMSETWLRPGITDTMVGLPGYSLFRCDREGRSGGGVGFYLSERLSATILRSWAETLDVRPEFIIAEICVENSAKLLIAVVYRPPNSGYLNEFFQVFMELHGNYRHSIILGDFNADMNTITFDSQQLRNFVTSSNLHLVPYESTHHLKDSSTLLDLCIIDNVEKLKDYGQCGVQELAFAVVDRGRPFCHEREKDLARRTWRRRRCDSNYNRFKVLRNRAQNLVRDAKREYYTNKFSKADSARDVWSGLRQLGLIKSRENGKRLSHSPEELNEFFVGGHERPRPAGAAFLTSLEDVLAGNFSDEDFHWKYVTPEMIGRAISKIKSNAVGIDGLSLTMLRTVTHAVMPVMEHLFNFSLMNGVFPSGWKSALVCPIPKVKCPTMVQHYRPISILPTLSKALERVVSEQIRAWMDETCLYDPCQSAYRRHHSTQTSLIRLLDKVRGAADDRMVTVSALFDFSKAFDRVDHLLLASKLRKLNFSDSTVRWIFSYLNGRTQAVRNAIENTTSSLVPVRTGVPQGSVLGPLLFTLYLSDFRQVLKHCKYNYYADNLLVYLHGKPKDLVEVIGKVNEDIEAILGWTQANGLILNSEKTKAIIFGTTRYLNSIDSTVPPSIRVGGTEIRYFFINKIFGRSYYEELILGKTNHINNEEDLLRLVSA